MKKLVYKTTITRIRYILQGKLQLLIQKRQILKKKCSTFLFCFFSFFHENFTTLKKNIKKHFLKNILIFDYNIGRLIPPLVEIAWLPSVLRRNSKRLQGSLVERIEESEPTLEILHPNTIQV